MKNSNNDIQDVLGNILGNALYDKVTVDHKETLLRYLVVRLDGIESKLDIIENFVKNLNIALDKYKK